MYIQQTPLPYVSLNGSPSRDDQMRQKSADKEKDYLIDLYQLYGTAHPPLVSSGSESIPSYHTFTYFHPAQGICPLRRVTLHSTHDDGPPDAQCRPARARTKQFPLLRSTAIAPLPLTADLRLQPSSAQLSRPCAIELCRARCSGRGVSRGGSSQSPKSWYIYFPQVQVITL